eukprot:Skav229139  [mRNA]  locus=scaffold1875:115393:127050:+ [translate_table: standard]
MEDFTPWSCRFQAVLLDELRFMVSDWATAPEQEAQETWRREGSGRMVGGWWEDGGRMVGGWWGDGRGKVMWFADMVIAFPVNSSQLRLIRLARLLRLVRLVRVVRGFDSLIVMTTALQQSANGLFWVAVIMFVVQLLFALLLHQVFVSMVGQTPFSREDEQVLFQYFGTFPRAMLTMFQVTLGTWVPVARVLQEIIGPAMNMFTILHKVTIGFACIGVTCLHIGASATFATQCVAKKGLGEKGHVDGRLHAEKMKAFFDLADQSGDTIITRDKWKDVMASPSTKQWFAAQGLSIQDPDEVFTLLDADRSDAWIEKHVGRVVRLIFGVAKLHGPARSLDLAILAEQQRRLMLLLEDLLRLRLDLVVPWRSAMETVEGGLEGWDVHGRCGFLCMVF